MNPIPLTAPDGEILAWACARCRVAANAWSEDCGQAFAEQCGRCYSCGAPETEPHTPSFAADRGCKDAMSRIGAQMVDIALADPEFFRVYTPGSKVDSLLDRKAG